MFTCCAEDASLAAVLHKTKVISATVDRENRIMRATMLFPRPMAPVDIASVEEGIAAEFGLKLVTVSPVYPKSAAPKRPAGEKKPLNTVLFGRAPSGSVTPMDKVTLELGKATVRGEIFDVQHREIPKRGAWVMQFDMTDYTNSIRVSKFLTNSNAGEIVSRIKPGMFVTVSGVLSLSRFDGEIVLEPTGIALAEREKRTDAAEEKRVELHLHTRMSAMDALTDVKEVISRAVEWGHPAIAITDHGVVQSFPDAMHAAGDKIKVIYGVEGYFVNDVDSRLAVFGNCTGTPEDEIVVFDIETTGLSTMRDTITEIGAVIMKGGVEIGRFQTFANPGRPIPPTITQLTGISDEDVKDAPSQKEAVKAFLEFAGGRVLAAHNASFDIGFIHEACLRHGLDFEPRFVDTLALARHVPDMKSHKLDLVAARWAAGVPAFTAPRTTPSQPGLSARLFAMLRRRAWGPLPD